MIKKLVLTGGALALLSSLTLGVPLLSYARCGVDWLRGSASDAMPVEWELKRARQMIADLKPEISNNAKRIAREKVDVVRLQSQLEKSEERLAKTQTDIERLTDDLKAGSREYVYNGRTYTYTQVKADLGVRFKRFQTRRDTADKLQQMLAARKASLQSAQDRMDAMIDAKRQLEVEVENLQARLAALRVEQASSPLNFDDSHLSRTRDLLDEISARIDVEEETMHVDVEYYGGEMIDLDDNGNEDLVETITTYFGEREERNSGALVAIQLD